MLKQTIGIVVKKLKGTLLIKLICRKIVILISCSNELIFRYYSYFIHIAKKKILIVGYFAKMCYV